MTEIVSYTPIRSQKSNQKCNFLTKQIVNLNSSNIQIEIYSNKKLQDSFLKEVKPARPKVVIKLSSLKVILSSILKDILI